MADRVRFPINNASLLRKRLIARTLANGCAVLGNAESPVTAAFTLWRCSDMS